jgi:ribosomal protein S18 acetylase RimI-like enzyme
MAKIRMLTASDAPACDAIILSLPEHFGLESGRRACARAVRTCEGLVAIVTGQVVGFLTIERHFAASAEITWMAVHATQRRHGIGSALMQRICRDLHASGCRLLLVATQPESVDERGIVDTYVDTRAFYEKVGFIPMCVAPNYWGSGSPALLLALPLDRTPQMVGGGRSPRYRSTGESAFRSRRIRLQP